MGGQNRAIVIMLVVLAALVLAIGGLSAVLLAGGGSDDSGDGIAATNGGGGTTTDSGGDAAGDGGGAGSRLRLAAREPVTLDPAIVVSAESAEYIVEIYSGLVTITPDLEIVPDLAESYEVSGGGTVYTFTLRDDIFFHNGGRVTAEDVRWSIERAASPEVASPVARAYLGDIVGAQDRIFGLAETIEGIEVIDERTIRFTIDAPKPYFLAKLTYPTAFVVDRRQIEGNPRTWTQRPNGTGPYRLREWRVGERIVLEANRRYHLGAPSVQQVVFELAGGSTLTRFENGELDVASVGINDLDRARDPNSAIGPYYQTFPRLLISYIAFNTKVPPFDDVNVRRALAHSINRDLITKVTFNGMFSTATGILMPQLPGYTPEDKTLPFDPDEARRLLAESTYGSAENLPPIVMTEVGGGAAAAIDTQAFIEEWRQELGVEVRIQQTDYATYLSDVDAGRLQMFNGGWSMDYPDAESMLDLKLHSASALNDVGYANVEVDALLEAARVEQDPDARLQLYRDAERLIIEDAVWIPLYFAPAHVVVSPDVSGWIEPLLILPRLRFVEVNR